MGAPLFFAVFAIARNRSNRDFAWNGRSRLHGAKSNGPDTAREGPLPLRSGNTGCIAKEVAGRQPPRAATCCAGNAGLVAEFKGLLARSAE